MNVNDYAALVGKIVKRRVMTKTKNGDIIFVEKELPALTPITGFISTSLDRRQGE